MNRRQIIAACLAGLCGTGRLTATDLPAAPTPVAESRVDQQARARRLIQFRAAQESRERQARMEARRRAGVSLQRPAGSSPLNQSFAFGERIDHGLRRVGPLGR